MKVSVCGSSNNPEEELAKKAYRIGKELAGNKVLVLTGSGTGYPYEAARGAYEAEGSVLGISPAKNREEHLNKYKFPTDSFTEIEYTGMGIPARNYPLVQEGDAIILIGGQIGSLNEFTIAFHQNKPIGVLKGSGGITPLISKIADVCDKTGEKANISYSERPAVLVKKVLRKL